MPAKKREADATFAALQAVHEALRPLSAEDRARVLDSVVTLLDVATPSSPLQRQTAPSLVTPVPGRRPSVVEILSDRKPVTIPGKIVLFAYYREKYEGLSRFARDDLVAYFGKAKETPPTHFGREFDKAVKKGWLHEEGADSYITSRGIEEVESGFPSERKWTKTTKKSKAKKSTPK
jgi:hypothetical protein